MLAARTPQPPIPPPGPRLLGRWQDLEGSPLQSSSSAMDGVSLGWSRGLGYGWSLGGPSHPPLLPPSKYPPSPPLPTSLLPPSPSHPPTSDLRPLLLSPPPHPIPAWPRAPPPTRLWVVEAPAAAHTAFRSGPCPGGGGDTAFLTLTLSALPPPRRHFLQRQRSSWTPPHPQTHAVRPAPRGCLGHPEAQKVCPSCSGPSAPRGLHLPMADPQPQAGLGSRSFLWGCSAPGSGLTWVQESLCPFATSEIVLETHLQL